MKIHAYRPNLMQYREDIVKMDMAGVTLTKIAKKYDVTHQAISLFLKVHRRGSVSRKVRTNRKKIKIEKFLNADSNLPDMAENAKVSLAGLYGFCKRNKVQYKKRLSLNHPNVQKCAYGHDVTDKNNSLYIRKGKNRISYQCKICKAISQKKLK